MSVASAMFSRWEGFCENDSLDGPSGGGEVPNWGWLISREGRPPGGLPAALKECGVRCSSWAFLPVVTRPQKDTRGLVVPTLRAVSERSCRLTLKLNANYSASAAGGLIVQSGSNVPVTCRSSVRRRRTAASPSGQLELPTLTRRSLLRPSMGRKLSGAAIQPHNS